MTFDIRGVKYELSFSFFALLCLTLLLSDKSISLVCLISSFLHESGHILPLYIFKSPPKKVVLAFFGMRIEREDNVYISYKKEAVIAIGGISVNLLLSAFGLLLWLITESKTAFILLWVNIFIALLNSIPVCVLDLGRFLRYILLVRYDEEKVNRITDKVSDVSVVSVVAITVLYTVFIGVNLSLFAVSLYLLILNIQERR